MSECRMKDGGMVRRDEEETSVCLSSLAGRTDRHPHTPQPLTPLQGCSGGRRFCRQLTGFLAATLTNADSPSPPRPLFHQPSSEAEQVGGGAAGAIFGIRVSGTVEKDSITERISGRGRETEGGRRPRLVGAQR